MVHRWLRPFLALLMLFGCRSTSLLFGLCAKTSVEMFKLVQPVVYSETIKKSKFLVHCEPAGSVDEAIAVIDRVKDLKANHNCWAFRSREVERQSDDGEPGGTAGRPILTAIEAAQLVDVVVVVTRYFGGIKLGTGGLIRAYHGVVRNALSSADKIANIPTSTIQVQVPIDYAGLAYRTLNAYAVGTIRSDYSSSSHLVLELTIADQAIEKVKLLLQDSSRGMITVHTK